MRAYVRIDIPHCFFRLSLNFQFQQGLALLPKSQEDELDVKAWRCGTPLMLSQDVITTHGLGDQIPVLHVLLPLAFPTCCSYREHLGAAVRIYTSCNPRVA